MYIYMYLYIYVYINMIVCTYTYIHTCSHPLVLAAAVAPCQQVNMLINYLASKLSVYDEYIRICIHTNMIRSCNPTIIPSFRLATCWIIHSKASTGGVR